MTTRERIIRAATRNLLRQGYKNTSLSDIAKEVGIKKPSIYYHFQSKQDLFEAVIDHLFLSIGSRLVTSEKDISPRHQLEHFFNTIIEINSELSLLSGESFDRPFAFVAHLRVYINSLPSLKNHLNVHYSNIITQLTKILANGQNSGVVDKRFDPQQLAFELIARIEGLCLMAEIYDHISINTLRKFIHDGLWVTISPSGTDDSQEKKRRGFSKALSLGTKW